MIDFIVNVLISFGSVLAFLVIISALIASMKDF